MRCFILIILVGLIIFSFLIYNISWFLFYEIDPRENILKEDLIGTWELITPITVHSLFIKKQPSLIILKQDESYEIHNPPKYVKRFCESLPKKQIAISCGQVIVGGKWFIHTSPLDSIVGFKEAPDFAHRLRGRSDPYQFWYCEFDPDVAPMYRWKRISKETQCPYCQCNFSADSSTIEIENPDIQNGIMKE
jgi:hypothetical protein